VLESFKTNTPPDIDYLLEASQNAGGALRFAAWPWQADDSVLKPVRQVLA
jgi:hypothetical protein